MSTSKPPEAGPTQAEALIQIATELYRIGQSDAGEPFAVRRGGANLALPFRGGRSAFRATLAREYRSRYGKTVGASALADALATLEGMALDSPPEPLALRVADHDDGVVIDLGTQDGKAVVVTPGGWDARQQSPVLFRRTALTASLPTPVAGGELAPLRRLVNVTVETWQLVIGWLVAAFMPSIPHPVLMYGGTAGAGKSTAARMLMRLFDPTTADHNQPRDPEQWAIAAAGSYGVLVDNVSSISPWWSDALCRAVTGDGWIRRKLFTDADLSVLKFRRVVALTSIDAGALRGDLADRLLIVDLEAISNADRRTEKELWAQFDRESPQVFGAVLDLLVLVLAALPSTSVPSAPRMADFARVLVALGAASDAFTGTLGLYLGQRNRIAEDVIEADPVAIKIRELASEKDPFPWEGTFGELLEKIKPEKPGKEWPKTPNAMSARVRRLVPALKEVHVEVTIPRQRSSRGRVITIEKWDEEASLASPKPQRPFSDSQAAFARDGTTEIGSDRHRDRHLGIDGHGFPNADSDGRDDGDAFTQSSSGDDGQQWRRVRI